MVKARMGKGVKGQEGGPKEKAARGGDGRMGRKGGVSEVSKIDLRFKFGLNLFAGQFN